MSNPIVGIGELLWDVFPDGRKVAGGAPFNFAFHCQQLGHDAVIVSRVGDDALGRELRAEVRRLGLSDEFIQTDTDHPTGTVQVTVDANGQPSYEIADGVAWDFMGLDELPDKGFFHDVVAICYGTLAMRHPIPGSTIKRLIEPGSEMSAALRVFDVNFRPPYVPGQAVIRQCVEFSDWVKVNVDEFLEITRKTGMSSNELLQWHERVGHRENPVWIVTSGSSGVEIHTSDEIYTIPGVPARVVDTVGAGDSFTAAMVCLHLEGRPLRECAQFATHYAARVCEHRGATPRIDRAEVERAAFG